MRKAVLEAALAELAEAGYAALGFEAVARRAGVHKTTLYRRWGTRENLLLDAMLQLGTERVPIPDTGSLRGDLLQFGREVAAGAGTPEVQAIIRAVASVGEQDPALAEASRRFWSTRTEVDAEMVDRAIARGEIPRETDRHLVIEAMLGAMYFRVLLTGQELDDEFLEGLADMVATGAGVSRCSAR